LAVYGPPASEVFAPVPEQRLIRAVHDEVRWGQEHGHLSYAVLNACRALRFATDGVTAEANRFVGQVLDELSRQLEPREDRDQSRKLDAEP
jgi:hypothetical protein